LLSLENATSFKDIIQYLGHAVSKDGLYVDPHKTKSITEWSVLRNVTHMRCFMGIMGYYRKFIEGFSKIAYHIASLQKKRKKFEWNEKCMQIFNKLSNLLTTAPILKTADPFNYFVACVYTCKEGLGEVLIQGNCAVSYEPRKLKEHEKNYATNDLELATIIHALKMW